MRGGCKGRTAPARGDLTRIKCRGVAIVRSQGGDTIAAMRTSSVAEAPPLRRCSARLRLAALCLGLSLAPLRPAAAEIRELATMADLEGVIDAGTLVVFDIDNTLLWPSGALGSDEWFYFIDRLYRLRGLSAAEAGARAMRTWNETQRRISVGPVEAGTVALVARLAARGVPMMALTARTLDVAELTLAQLAGAGLALDGRLPGGDLAFDGRLPRSVLGSEDDAWFTRGVLFVGESNDKGRVLVQYLQRRGLKPGRVVFVDDKAKHVRNVEAALNAVGVPCLALRYGAADAKVARFNEVMSEVKDAASARLFLDGEP